MITIQEGDQLVSFEDDSKVIKLDEHRYYSYVSGRGFKGVDFLVIQMGVLFLIELKNYQDPLNKPNKEEVSAIFYQKCEDTLHLIEIVNQYFIKKWRYRFFVRRLKLHFLVPSQDKIWLEAYQLQLDKKVILIGDFEI